MIRARDRLLHPQYPIRSLVRWAGDPTVCWQVVRQRSERGLVSSWVLYGLVPVDNQVAALSWAYEPDLQAWEEAP